MRKVYLFSSLILPVSFDYKYAIVVLEEVDLSKVKEVLREGFISAVGHPSTARFLSSILGVKIDCNRESVYLSPRDLAVAIQFKERVQGLELGEKEIMSMYEKGELRFIIIKFIEGDSRNKI